MKKKECQEAVTVGHEGAGLARMLFGSSRKKMRVEKGRGCEGKANTQSVQGPLLLCPCLRLAPSPSQRGAASPRDPPAAQVPRVGDCGGEVPVDGTPAEMSAVGTG